MGASYANIAVQGLSQQSISGFFAELNVAAVVGPEEGGWCVCSDAFSDMMDYEILTQFMKALSKSGRLALGVSVYDEQQFRLWLASDGDVRSTYDSCPGMELEDPSESDMKPVLTGSGAWPELFPFVESEEKLLNVFRVGSDEEFVDPLELHGEIVSFLRLPRYCLDFGYRYVTASNYGFEGADEVLKNTKIINGRTSFI